MNAISFMSANYVARETGWDMRGWGHGDRTTNERFRPEETFGERFDELLGAVRALGFDAIDVWGAHLNPEWATDAQVEAARAALVGHGLRVASLAAWIGPATAERACEIARALGTDLIGGGGRADLVPALRRHGVRLALENHPERSPRQILDRIAEGAGWLGATVDTGWWATQGYDPVRAIEELGEHVLHVHLKDVRAVGEPHVTCPWGDGIVPVEECIRALRRIGYAGAISIEHEPEDEDPSEACRAMRAQLEGWLA